MGPVDIIVTRSAVSAVQQFISKACSKMLTALLVATLSLIVSVSASAVDYSVGIVIEGAFLLSDIPNVKRENRYVYGLVGYLPVGTRVYLNGETEEVTNLSEGGRDTYFHVFSSIGIKGLIRQDRFQKVDGNRIAVAVSSYEVALHNPDPATDPDPAKGKFKKMGTIGRYGGNYLEITDDGDEIFYKAILHRSHPTANLKKSEKVRLWKELVNQGAVILVNPEKFSETNLPAPLWSKYDVVEKESVEVLVEKVKEKFGDNLDKVREWLGDSDNFQCLLKADGSAQLGFNVFGTGLSFKMAVAFKDQDHMFRFGMRTLRTGPNRVKYTFLKNVKCDGATPERLHQLTIQKGLYDSAQREFIRLKYFVPKLQSKWITSLAGKEIPFRMIHIQNEPGYAVALRRLDKFVSAGNSFLAKILAEQKEIFLNLILREISYFEPKDILLKRQPNLASR